MSRPIRGVNGGKESVNGGLAATLAPVLTHRLTSNHTALIDPKTGCALLVVRDADDVPDPFPTPADDVSGIPGALTCLSMEEAEHNDAWSQLFKLGFTYGEDYDGGEVELAVSDLLDGSTVYALTPLDPADLIGDLLGDEHLESWRALELEALTLA